jgi:hypothetical protein
MRRIVFPVVFLIASIMIGVAMLVLRPQAIWAPMVAAITGKAREKTGSTTSPFAKTKAGEKNRPAHSGPRSDESPGTVTVTVIPGPPPDRPRRFPLGHEIAKGMTKADVLASFGTPTATVAGADVGQLLERLVYSDPPTRRTTSIYLADGKVIRAETYP